jgi:prepilin signal peptidase PulO-like enzyme (type II secretory pathway)
MLVSSAIILFFDNKSIGFGSLISIFSFLILSFSAWFLLIKKIIALPIIAVVTKYAALFIVLFEASKKDWFNLKQFAIGYSFSFLILVIIFVFLNKSMKDKSVSI